MEVGLGGGDSGTVGQLRSGFFKFDAVAHIWCEVAVNGSCMVTDDRLQRLN